MVHIRNIEELNGYRKAKNSGFFKVSNRITSPHRLCNHQDQWFIYKGRHFSYCCEYGSRKEFCSLCLKKYSDVACETSLRKGLLYLFFR